MTGMVRYHPFPSGRNSQSLLCCPPLCLFPPSVCKYGVGVARLPVSLSYYYYSPLSLSLPPLSLYTHSLTLSSSHTNPLPYKKSTAYPRRLFRQLFLISF